MKVQDIITNCNLLEIIGNKDLEIASITFDSRKVESIVFCGQRHPG